MNSCFDRLAEVVQRSFADSISAVAGRDLCEQPVLPGIPRYVGFNRYDVHGAEFYFRAARAVTIIAMTREQAWELLCEYTKSDGLRRHALAVEACVTAYARKFGEDEAKWSETALLHDFDWEIHPTLPDHPTKGEPILAARGVDPEIR